MNLTIDRDALAALVRTASAAVAGRTTNPVLKCVKVTAGDGTATLSATNMELYVTGRAPGCDTQRAGTCLVPADVLEKAVKLAPAGPVSVQADKQVHVKYAGGGYKINSEDPLRFPEWVPPQVEGQTFAVPAGTLTTLLTRVAFCSSESSSQSYATAGVLLEVRDGELVAVGMLDSQGRVSYDQACQHIKDRRK